jgi:hypothetical protein
MAPAGRGSAHGSGEPTSSGTMLCYANFYLSVNSFFAIYQPGDARLDRRLPRHAQDEPRHLAGARFSDMSTEQDVA